MLNNNNKYNDLDAGLVNVVMPANNAATFIGAAIESVLQQSHTKLKLFVVDDGSTDNTVDVVTNFVIADNRVKLIQLDVQSGGPATPRNKALQIIRSEIPSHTDDNAEGDFIAFIDADDVWHLDKLSCQIQTMNTQDLDFTSTEHVKFSNATNSVLPTPIDLNTFTPASASISHEQMLRKNKIVCSGVMLRANLAQWLHFSEQTEFIGVEDYLAWLHVLQNTPARAAIIQAPLVFYRLRRDSLSNSKIKMAAKIYNLLSDYSYGGKPLGVRKYRYFVHYIMSGIGALIADKFK